MRNIKLYLGLTLLLLGALPAFGQVIVEFPAVNDGYVHNLEPNITFGSETGMLIGAKAGATGSVCHSYVQYDMAGYDGDPVHSATLYLYVGASESSGMDQSFSLYLGAGDSWAQDTLTWNNAPGYLPEVLGTRTNNFQPGWVAIDVSEVVATTSEIGGKISFVAVQNSSPAGSWINFMTSEWSPRDNQRPFLEIRFEGTVPSNIISMDDVKSLFLN